MKITAGLTGLRAKILGIAVGDGPTRVRGQRGEQTRKRLRRAADQPRARGKVAEILDATFGNEIGRESLKLRDIILCEDHAGHLDAIVPFRCESIAPDISFQLRV